MASEPAHDPIWTRPEPGSRRPAHTRDEIAETALRIADTEGFEAVTMRRVAEELGAGTMTLYHYVRNKDDLLALMSDELMGELIVPDDELAATWRAALTQIADRTFGVFKRHPWVIDAAAMRGLKVGPNGMRHFDQSLAAVASLDAPDAVRLEVISMVDDYVFGFAVREIEVAEHAPGPGEEWPETLVEYTEAQLDTGAYPHITAFFAGGDPRATWDRLAASMADRGRFERGVSRLLAGIALDLEQGEKPGSDLGVSRDPFA
jgi:AcrR family transcriptional regulator